MVYMYIMPRASILHLSGRGEYPPSLSWLLCGHDAGAVKIIFRILMPYLGYSNQSQYSISGMQQVIYPVACHTCIL